MDRDMIVDYLKRGRAFEGIKRELEVPIGGKKIKALVGPRRAGKTYYLLYLKDELKKRGRAALYLDFENIFLRDLTPREVFEVIALFEEIFGKAPEALLLDEVQNLTEWQSLLRTLLDYGYDMYVTGSSSKLLSKEIATQLRGRALTYLLLPFSFSEFLAAKGVEVRPPLSLSERAKMRRALEEYLVYGGYPEVVLGEEKEKVLKSYMEEIFFKDFVERHQLESMQVARFIYEYLFQNFSKEVSISTIYRFAKGHMKVARKTVAKYVEKLQDTFAVFFLSRYSRRASERASWPKKVYVADVGLPTVLSFSKDMGKRMENAVFLHLLRGVFNKGTGELYYLKQPWGEVDFVLHRRGRVEKLLQVTYAKGEEDIEKREWKALIKASQLTGCKQLEIITWDYEGKEEREGKSITYTPLWKWLLSLSPQTPP